MDPINQPAVAQQPVQPQPQPQVQPQPLQPPAAAPTPPQPKENIASVGEPRYGIDSFGTIIFVIVLVESLILLGLNFYQKSQITSFTNQLTAAQTKLQSPTYATVNNEVNQVLSGSALLQTVLNSRVDWSKFYGELNAVTPSNVQLTTLSIAENGTFKADGRSDTLTSLAQAMVAWQQGVASTVTPFANVSLDSDSLLSNGTSHEVTFSISGQINVGALK